MSAPSRNGFPAVTAWHACAKLGSADGRPSRTSASAAAGPSARGRSGPSGAAASSSASRSGWDGGSPERTAQTTASRSSSRRPASCASHRSDGASAQWTSSTRSTVGARSARLAARYSSPCAAACIASPVSAGSGVSGCSTRPASPAAPVVSSLQLGSSLQRGEELTCDAPRRVLLERAGARAQHRRPLCLGTAARGGEEARLADPGRALHHDDATRPGSHLLEPIGERRRARYRDPAVHRACLDRTSHACPRPPRGRKIVVAVHDAPRTPRRGPWPA